GYEGYSGDCTVSNETDYALVSCLARGHIVGRRADGHAVENNTPLPDSVVVVIAPPQPGFTVEPASGTVGQSVQFTNTTSGDVSGYEWDFGDGTTSTEANPTHVYKMGRAYV